MYIYLLNIYAHINIVHAYEKKTNIYIYINIYLNLTTIHKLNLMLMHSKNENLLERKWESEPEDSTSDQKFTLKTSYHL